MQNVNCSLFFILLLCNLFSFLSGQQTKSKKALSYFSEGLKYYSKNEISKAISFFFKAIQEDSTFAEPYIVLGDIYYDSLQMKKAKDYYIKGRIHSPSLKPGTIYRLANSLYLSGEYQEALFFIKDYKKLMNNDTFFLNKILKLEECLNVADSLYRNQLDIKIWNAGPEINSPDDEYFPSISLDEKILIFTRAVKVRENIFSEDFFYSENTGGGWLKARPLGPPINTPFNEGAQTYSYDGSYLLFVRCNFPEGYGSCDIWLSKKSENGWEKPILLPPPLNTQWWESQPSLASNNSTIYFVSNRPGGKGKKDIWKINCNLEDFQCEKPSCLNINTPENEMSPFIHPDNITLYFSSDGYCGLGLLDIFMSKFQGDSFSTPVNLGSPINTSKDDNSFIVFPSGKLAVMASSREGTLGGLDLYFIEIPPQLRPSPIIILTGKTLSSDNSPVEAIIEVYELSDTTLLAKSKSYPKNGNFKIPLPSDKELLLLVSAVNHFPYSKTLYFKGESKLVESKFVLTRVDEGISVPLKHIYFDFDSYVLKDESKIELDHWVRFLSYHKNIYIQVEGHTDSIGNPQYNLMLSEKRAKAVADYLTSKGIEFKRVKYKGFGNQFPVASNTDEESRALNRRTEIKIIKIEK